MFGEVPLLSGFEFDHSSVVIRILALTFKGITDYKVGSQVTGEKMLFGMSRTPVARTRGNIQAKPWSFNIYTSQWNQILALPQFLLGYHEAIFDFQVEKKELGGGPRIQIDKIVGARVLDAEESSKEGGDAIMMAISGSALRYERDNFLSVAPSLGF